MTEEKILNIMEKGASRKIIQGLLNASLRNPVTRRALINSMAKATYKMAFKTSNRPDKVNEDRYYMGKALLRSIEKSI